MPSRGVVNNPAGANGVQMFEHESAYGEIKRMKEMTQAAPLPANRAINTPRRSQRRAVGGQEDFAGMVERVAARMGTTPEGLRQQLAARMGAPQPASQPAPVTGGAFYAAAWASLAALPGASERVREMAALASQMPPDAPSKTEYYKSLVRVETEGLEDATS